MSLDLPHWQGRRKRFARRLAYDLRFVLPIVGMVFCLVVSAIAISQVVRVDRTDAAIRPAVSANGPAAAAVAADRRDRRGRSLRLDDLE